MAHIFGDVKFGLRMMRKHPGFTAMALTAFAIGIGVTTAEYSSADALLYRPLLIPEFDRVMVVNAINAGSSAPDRLPPADYLDFRRGLKYLENISATAYAPMDLTSGGDPVHVTAYRATPSLFRVLGGKPALGRAFLDEEENPEHAGVVVLSHGLWERRYGLDPEILGRTVELDGQSFRIVGVMPKDFRYPPDADLWIPFVMNQKEKEDRGACYVTAIGRLKPGVPMSTADAEVRAFGQRLREQFPGTHARRTAELGLLREQVTGRETAQFSKMILGASIFLLLICCANVANLQFARMSARSREVAVRTAIGAGRWRLVGQFLTESILLATGGAILGLVIASWSLDVMKATIPAEVAVWLPGWQRLGLNPRVLALSIATALGAAIVSGIGPALLASRGDLTAALKEGARGSTTGTRRHLLRNALVFSEMVFAVVLLVGAGLMMNGFNAIMEPGPNLDAGHVLVTTVSLPSSRYSGETTRWQFMDKLLDAARNLPGVESAALVSASPYASRSDNYNISLEGMPAPQVGMWHTATVNPASSGYFGAARVPIKEGRDFTEQDRAGTEPVAIVSETFARQYFAGQAVLGRRVKIGVVESDFPWARIVGVAADIRHDPLDKVPRRMLYFPYRQWTPQTFDLMIRTEADPTTLASAIRQKVKDIDPKLPLAGVKTWRKQIDDQLVGLQHVAAMMGICGFLALFLSSIGVYGVMAFAVTERRHEIGVRMAVGASGADVLWAVMRSGIVLTACGLAVGAVLSIGLARLAGNLIFGVGTYDLTSFAIGGGVLAISALLACFVPARRALAVDPIDALRAE